MNPFRIDDKPGADTRSMVRHVLAFMEYAFETIEKGDGCFLEGAMLGAASILGACSDALKESEPEGGDDGQ